jgi:hypothetical protein
MGKNSGTKSDTHSFGSMFPFLAFFGQISLSSSLTFNFFEFIQFLTDWWSFEKNLSTGQNSDA